MSQVPAVLGKGRETSSGQERHRCAQSSGSEKEEKISGKFAGDQGASFQGSWNTQVEKAGTDVEP